jgi:hypothetical protein
VKLEEIEELPKRKETQQFYLKTGQLKKGFQPRTSFCKNKNGDLIGDNEGVLKRWAEYFRELLIHRQMEKSSI